MTQLTPPKHSANLNKNSSNSFPLQNILPVFWLSIVVVLLVATAFIFNRGLQIETSLLSLLPSSKEEVLLQKSAERFSSQVSRRLFFLVGNKSEKDSRSAALKLVELFEKSVHFSTVQVEVKSQQLKAWYDFYFPYRYQNITAEMRNLLNQQDAAEQLLLRLQKQLYSPLPLYSARLLKDDPLLFFPALLASLPKPPGKLEVIDGMLTVRENGMNYILVNVSLSDDPFKISQQAQISGQITQALAVVESEISGTSILSSGAFRFVAAGSAEAQREVSSIGLGSLIGIFIIMLLTFRSPRQIIVAVLPIVIGILAAFTVSSFVFPKLHLLTRVFGASLIGVSIDYSFHYLVKHRMSAADWNGWVGLRAVFSAVTMGLVTSVLGYAGFYLTPFPALQQIAVFSSVGLLAAYGTVVCWFPVLMKNPPEAVASKPLTMFPVSWFLSFFSKQPRQSFMTTGMLLVVVGCVFSLMSVQYNDDIRALENLSPELKSEEEKIRSLIGGLDVSRFIVVRGGNVEELLQHQEKATLLLKKYTETNILSSGDSQIYFQSLAPFLVSRKKQTENLRLSKNVFIDGSKKIAQGLADLGFEADSGKRLIAEASQAEQYFTASQWLESPVSEPLRHLWLGQIDSEYVSLIMLSNGHDPEAVKSLFRLLPGVEYINQLERFTALFKLYREETTRFVALAYVIVFIFLLWKYHFRKAVIILVPPALATLLTFSVLTFSGQSLNIFNIVSALLILGIGVDYTIFFAESKNEAEETGLAIMLSAFTTLLSFGLLFLSQTPALASIGLTITLGIAFALLLSPLARTN